MSAVVIKGDTSGSISLTVPLVAGANTATLPAATGTVMVSGNMPAFSAYASAAVTVTSATFTKVQINTKEFDTNSNFDNVTNYRFTPTVAGYYQVNAQLNITSGNTRAIVLIYKNSSPAKVGNDIQASTPNGVNISCLIYMNGTTDYLEMYGYTTSGTTVQFLGGTGSTTYFQAAMVRGA